MVARKVYLPLQFQAAQDVSLWKELGCWHLISRCFNIAPWSAKACLMLQASELFSMQK